MSSLCPKFKKNAPNLVALTFGRWKQSNSCVFDTSMLINA